MYGLTPPLSPVFVLLPSLGSGRGLFLISACGSGDKGGDQKKAAPPPAVVVSRVQPKTVPLYGEYVARTEARQSVEIRARVEGFLEKVLFKEGSEVKAGRLLFVIDQRPYKAALQDARGSLAQAQAAMEKDQKDVDRLRPLFVKIDRAPIKMLIFGRAT